MDLTTVDQLLTTTRSVRKRLDLKRPVEPEIIEHCMDIAFQAPTGGNRQNWFFLVITEAEKKKAIADLYRKGFDSYIKQPRPEYRADDPRARQMPRVVDSAMHLLQHMHEVPVLVIACIEGRVEKESVFEQASTYGSILPAVWSFALALRARGLGSVWTTIHLLHEKEAAKILGIPDTVTQTALLPVAYFTGTDFKPARRLPSHQFTYWNTWGQQR